MARGRIVVFAALLLAACGTTPVTGPQERERGSAARDARADEELFRAARQMQGGDLAIDRRLLTHVRRVGARLARVEEGAGLAEIAVLDNSVPQAWVLPGGRLAVSRGLLRSLDCEAELAAVLAHVLAHGRPRVATDAVEPAAPARESLAALRAGTPGNPYAGLVVGPGARVADLLTRRHAAAEERAADRRALVHLARAGYDPAAGVALLDDFRRLADVRHPDSLAGFLAAHPPSAERVARARDTLAVLDGGGRRGCAVHRRATARLRELEPAFDRYDAAVAALGEGDLVIAESLARGALAAAPRYAKLHALLGEVALRRGDFRTALTRFDRAIELEAGHFAPYLSSGTAAVRAGRDAEAARRLDHSMSLLPTAAAAGLLGRLARDRGDLREAVHYWQLAASSDSATGRAAARELVTLDVPRHPERYVAVAPRIDRTGRVWMRIRNDAPMDVSGVVVVAAIAAPGGGLEQGPVRVDAAGALTPGEAVEVPTPLGLAPDSGSLARVRTEVQVARPTARLEP